MDSVKFLKTLNILYVEDDLFIREKVAGVLEQVFNSVKVASNGQEGLDMFTDCKNNSIYVDVIVSDINMPKISGLQMIKEIRKIDKDVPFILTTAYSNTDFLLEAIEYGVTHYAVKPVDLRELFKQIEDVCMTRYKLRIIENKNIELLEYMHIIDQVAVVSKIDLNGNYTFVNDIFCHVSGYNKQDLIGLNRNTNMHKDMPVELYEELWKTLCDGNKWNGKLKNSRKDNKEYFTKSTIMPYYDMNSGEIIEYVEISFVITVDEQEKRDFRKKVINNIKETKRQNYVARKMIDDLQGKLERFKHVDLLEEAILREREKTRKFKRQSQYYEVQLNVVNMDYKDLKIETNKKVVRVLQELEKEKFKSSQYFGKINDLKEELGDKIETCDSMQSRINKQSNKIKNLDDVIDFQDNKHKKKNSA